MSAPKFTVERQVIAGVAEFAVRGSDGFIVDVVHDPDLARVIESHAGLVEALERCAALLDRAGDMLYDEGAKPLGEACWEEMTLARAALAKARGEAQP